MSTKEPTLGVQLFSTTTLYKSFIDDDATTWIRRNPDKKIISAIITQSSDSRFHCYTLTFIWRSYS